MIERELDIKRLESLRKEIRFKDRGIFEKTVYALKLLEELLNIYPNLVFKGGTSILFYIFPPTRLSIDIDILLPLSEQGKLKGKLIKLAEISKWFGSIEEDIRGSKVPKAHYKFYYTSHFSRVPQYILLDTVFSNHSYKKLVKKNISEIPMVLFNSKAIVQIPTAEGLLGDKMTAVAPNTLGISLNEKRAMEVLKQIIDLGELFNVSTSLKDIRYSFINTAKQENYFRGTSFSVEEVVDDILDLAFKYSQSLLKGADNSFAEISLINSGLSKVTNHLSNKCGQQDIKVALAKIAYMALILKNNKANKFIKTVDLSLIKNKKMSDKYKILDRLKIINPEAYFYWVLAVGNRERLKR